MGLRGCVGGLEEFDPSGGAEVIQIPLRCVIRSGRGGCNRVHRAENHREYTAADRYRHGQRQQER